MSAKKTSTPTSDCYPTSDKQTCIALMMKFHVVKAQKEEDERLVYYFRYDEKREIALITDDNHLVKRELSVKEVIELIRSGRSDQILFSLNELWTAETTWIMNLRHNNFEKKGA